MNDVIRFWVMNATADDWESLEQIQLDVARSYLRIGPDAIAMEIMRLLELGLFEAMPRTPESAEQIATSPFEVWFRMTQRGRTAWESDSMRFA